VSQKKLDLFSFEHNFRKCCLILIILSLFRQNLSAHKHIIDAILLPAIHRVSGNHFVPAGQCTGTPCRTRATVSYYIKNRQTFLHPTCGLQTALISVLWIMRSGLSCSIVSTTCKSIVWMNSNGGSSMSGAVLNSRFLTRLLTSGEEDI